MPTLSFFDIADVTLNTEGTQNQITIAESGFQAYGLQNFSVAGDIQFTNNAPNLDLPTEGQFEYQGVLDLVGIAPVALDLDGDGLEFVPASAGAQFDYDGDATRNPTAWLGR